MENKEKFKAFMATNPAYASYVNSGEMTWQKFYEMYDMYGEENDIWQKYQEYERSNSKVNDIIKNIDIESIKKNISSARKALELIEELTSKGSSSVKKEIVTPRPLNKFFED